MTGRAVAAPRGPDGVKSRWGRGRLRQAGAPLLLVGFALPVILLGLGSRDIVNSHEARVVQTARAMAEAGWPWAAAPVEVPVVELVDVGKIKRLRPRADGATLAVNPWLVPVMNGAVRLQKPPLPYWAAAVSIKLFGYSEATARLPGAVLGGLSAGLVYALGRRAFGRRAGWCAGLAWASLYFPYDEHRKAMADPYLAFAALAAVWAWVRGVGRCRSIGVAGWRGEAASPARPLLRHPATRTPRHAFLFYLLLGLGTLAKGPVILLHAGAGVAAWHLCVGGRPAGRLWHHLVGLVVFAAAALPWPAYVLGHVPNAAELWRYESVGEFADNTEKARPPLFYLPALLLIALPWTAVWVGQAAAAAGRWWLGEATTTTDRRRRRRELFPVVWLILVAAVLSVAYVKKNAYLLPILPAVSLTVGRGLRRLTAARRLPRRSSAPTTTTAAAALDPVAKPTPTTSLDTSGFEVSVGQALAPRPAFPPVRRAAAWLVAAHVLLTTGFAALLPAMAWRAHHPGPSLFGTIDRPGLAVTIGGGLLAAVAVGSLLFVAARRRVGRRWPAAQAVAFAALTAALFTFVAAPADNRRSAKAACGEAVRLLAAGGRTIATHKMSEEVAVYLPADPYAAVRPDARFAAKVLLMWDDADGVEARRRRLPAPPFDPRGWQVEGGRVTAFARVPVPANPGDVRWKLYELTVDRTAVAGR